MCYYEKLMYSDEYYLAGCKLSEHYPFEIPAWYTGYDALSKKAPHIGHKKHLCYMCQSGDCSLEQVKTLVKDAKFICRICGRVAAAEVNLCNPAPL